MTRPQPESLAVPAVHRNGTGRAQLLEQHRRAGEALEEALAALPVPHLRDFYVLPDGEELFELACRQHAARANSLRLVMGEVQRLLAVLSTTTKEGRE